MKRSAIAVLLLALLALAAVLAGGGLTGASTGTTEQVDVETAGQRGNHETEAQLSGNPGPPYSSFVSVSNNPDVIDTLPTIATDPSGHVHIAWWGTYASPGAPDGVTTDVFYSYGAGQGFTVPISIPVTTGYYSKDVSVTADKDGYAHVAFRRSNNQIWLINSDDIYYATNRTGGFAPVLVVDGGPVGGPETNAPCRPSLAVDDSGTVHLVFLGSAGTQIFYTNNAAGTFATPTPVPGGLVWAVAPPKVAVDHSGNVHIAFRGESQSDQWGDVFYTNNVGGNFGVPINVSNQAGPEGPEVSLAVDSDGKAHIAYSRDEWPEICYVTNKHGNFGPPVCFGSFATHPDVAIDNKGCAHIAYWSEGEIMYASNVDGSFQPLQLTDSGRRIVVGQSRWFTVSSDGFMHVVFHVPAETLENYEVYYLGVPTPAPTATPTPPAGPTRTLVWGPGWHNGAWSGPDGTPPQEAFACAAGNYAAAYRLLNGSWERYFPGRPDISDMGPLNSYDAFLILITQPVTCLMPVASAPGASRTLQWGPGWHNEAWSGADGTPPQDAFACAAGSYAAAYRFVNGGWERYFPGRPDISDTGPLNKYDAFLILVTAPVSCTMAIAP